MNDLPLVRKVWNKTIASEIEGVKTEDIPKRIEQILSKAIKNVKIYGDGINKPIKMTFKNE